MAPFFSIVIPIYNAADYLNDCLQSIETQFYHNFEVIMVDDGSSDGSADICRLYQEKDDRFKYFYQNNKGSTSARKYASEKIRGEYVVCVDSDDWTNPDYLCKIKDVIDQYDVDVVRDTFCMAYKHKKIIQDTFLRKGYYNKKDIMLEIYPYLLEGKDGRYAPPSLCGTAIRKEIYKECQKKIADEIVLGEDQLVLILCMLQANSFYLINSGGYIYRQRKTSITKGFAVDMQNLWNSIEFIQALLKRVNNTVLCYDFEDQINRFLTHRIFIYGEFEFRKQDNYITIRKKVLPYLRQNNIKVVARDCRYKNCISGKLARLCVLNAWTFPMYLRSRWKRTKLLSGEFYD